MAKQLLVILLYFALVKGTLYGFSGGFYLQLQTLDPTTGNTTAVGPTYTAALSTDVQCVVDYDNGLIYASVDNYTNSVTYIMGISLSTGEIKRSIPLDNIFVYTLAFDPSTGDIYIQNDNATIYRITPSDEFLPVYTPRYQIYVNFGLDSINKMLLVTYSKPLSMTYEGVDLDGNVIWTDTFNSKIYPFAASGIMFDPTSQMFYELDRINAPHNFTVTLTKSTTGEHKILGYIKYLYPSFYGMGVTFDWNKRIIYLSTYLTSSEATSQVIGIDVDTLDIVTQTPILQQSNVLFGLSYVPDS